ncbi:estradiol 17-beta-dehydrogenase 8-like isoform X1 [Homarus americanus]|uniref:estradiol 17-beta-dehydrogenase 8-like isoform X1 n=1 Tax=Homarus americanus TaxID=6706 RepID=UPI001C4795FC|nr:estradiol 17-beta-dehydrogenase 8-like isoform X1 [Homarus americanus]
MLVPTLTGRVALVTGGGSGIGRAICQVLARDGADVVVADLNLQSANDTVSMLPGPGSHLALALDVRDKTSVDSVLATIINKYQQPPSLLANNAGISSQGAPHIHMTEEFFMNIVNTNLKGMFLVSQAVCKSLLDHGSPVCGAVVNMGSINSKTGLVNHCHYTASKAGIVALTKSSAAELAKQGIRVNCVLPGAIKTPLNANASPGYLEPQIAATPLGRMGEPEEVAEVVAFLLSEKSSYMVGSCVEVTGGFCM